MLMIDAFYAAQAAASPMRFSGARLPNRAELLDAVRECNGKQRCRFVTEAEVDAALRLRARSDAAVVRVWGGFVANSYGWRANCTTVALFFDGTFRVYRGSCGRPRGQGRTLTECAS